ncbi:MAG: S1C family serine protease [Dehalococcoidia bacterium]
MGAAESNGWVDQDICPAVTAVSVAVIAVISFAWFGPGLDFSTSPAAAEPLFDQAKVQALYDQVSPAVVEINLDRRKGETFIRDGFGSGFLIDRQGHIATNNHVIEGADRVRVKFLNETSYEATILGRNLANDLALLKVPEQAVAGIEPVQFGDASLVRPGHLAIAIGSPFRMEGSMTAGIISGVDRILPGRRGHSIYGVLQTDALIGPGNSGGPLLNADGEVVGINTAIQISPTWDRRTTGFAIPIDNLVTHLSQLKEERTVRPLWLGVGVVEVDPALTESLDLAVDRGVYVTGVVADSPADQSKIIPSGVDSVGNATPGGDVIVALEGHSISSISDLTFLLNHYHAQEQIEISLVRDGAEIQLPVTVDEWPAEWEETLGAAFGDPSSAEPAAKRTSDSAIIPGFFLPDVLSNALHR